MKKNWIIYTVSIIVLLAVMFLSYTIGSVNISFSEALKLLLNKLMFADVFDVSALPKSQVTILYSLRMPRVLVSAACGMSLAVVGAVFQGIFQNKLADPYVLGISSGASLGASLAVALSAAQFYFIFSSTALFAALGSLATVAFVILIYSLSSRRPSTLLLTGIAAGYFASGLSTLIVALNPDKIKVITMWAMGSFSSVGWEKAIATVPLSIVGVLVIMCFARDINAISTGEENAASFGVSVGFVKIMLVVTGSLLTALAVAASGVIGFIGLIIPNGLRLFIGPNYKRLIPFSAIFGAIFLVICDTLARIFYEIPVGAITAVIGTPVFVWLLLNERKRA